MSQKAIETPESALDFILGDVDDPVDDETAKAEEDTKLDRSGGDEELDSDNTPAKPDDSDNTDDADDDSDADGETDDEDDGDADDEDGADDEGEDDDSDDHEEGRDEGGLSLEEKAKKYDDMLAGFTRIGQENALLRQKLEEIEQKIGSIAEDDDDDDDSDDVSEELIETVERAIERLERRKAAASEQIVTNTWAGHISALMAAGMITQEDAPKFRAELEKSPELSNDPNAMITIAKRLGFLPQKDAEETKTEPKQKPKPPTKKDIASRKQTAKKARASKILGRSAVADIAPKKKKQKGVVDSTDSALSFLTGLEGGS